MADDADGADGRKATHTPPDEGAWDELIRKIETDPGAPFAPGVVQDLAAFKRVDRAGFEKLRARLRKAGCRVTKLDPLIAEANGEVGGGKPSQADILVALAEAAELFQTPDEEAYADIEVNGHRQTWPVSSRGFRRLLKRWFHEETGGAPSSESVAAAIGVIEAKALHDTPVRAVHVRVGELEGKIYIDLCDAAWRAIEVDKTGWRIIDRPAIRFQRTRDMRALPEPKRGGSIEDLRPLLNIRNDADGTNDFVLAVAYLLACLRGRGPYPIMVVTGEQGTAKSTRSGMLRSVVDPSKPRLRALPRDERDLVVAARNRLVLAFDNVSDLKWWLSDALCRIASGAGFGTRELYTDAEEVVFEGARPLILNGIEDIVDRPDLAERSIFSVCEVIPGKKRKEEDELWAEFDEAHPSILGALLDAVAEGLRRFPETRPPELPRMADFAHWAIACETALWREGAFIAAYNANILGAVETVIEASPVSLAVRKLMAGCLEWKGTSTVLLARLTELVDERVAKSDAWPRNGRALSGRLRRAASSLRQIRVHVAFEREGHEGARHVHITKSTPAAGAADEGKFASVSSAPSASNKNNGLDADDSADGGTGADGRGRDADDRPTVGPAPIVSTNPLKTNDADGADGADAKKRVLADPEGGGALLEAIVAYMADRVRVSDTPDRLFTAIGQPLDDEGVMIDLLSMIEDDLVERGIAMEISGGYVTMTRIEQKSVKTPATPNESNGEQNPQKSANPNEPRVGEPKSLEVASATSEVWIQYNDPRWSRCAALGRANGCPIRATRAPPNHPTARGYGAFVPASWLTRS
jgi:hypothetical protein